MPCYKVRMSHRASSWGRIRECSEEGDQIQEIRKLRGDFLSMALLKSCPNKDSAALVIWLNSTSLSLNSFLLSLTSASISKHAHPFIALLDSGSSHCFVDEVFAKKNKIALTKLPSTIPLRLFDGSAQNSVSHKTHIPLTFSTGKTHQMEFYITKLDKGYSVVLGYDWLVCHNPSIDWAETKVVFPGSVKAPEGLSTPIKPEFNIQFVSTKNISCLCHEPGNSFYCLKHHAITEDVTAPQVLPHHSETPSDSYHVCTSSLTPDPMNGIPIDYHKFHEVFSGIKADTLPPHQPYGLQISLEEGAKSFHGPIYSLSPPELTALQEFLEEHTQNGFICPTKSPWGAPVLFVKKKDGSLCLCVNFHALNNGEGPLSAPSHHRSAQHSRTRQDIYENRFKTCIPPCTYCGGRQTQNGIPNLLWIIRMESYALWLIQCSSSLSTIHQ